MQCKQTDFVSWKKVIVDFKSFVVWVKPISNYVFELISVHSRPFQTLAPLIIMPAQHMNPTD